MASPGFHGACIYWEETNRELSNYFNTIIESVIRVKCKKGLVPLTSSVRDDRAVPAQEGTLRWGAGRPGEEGGTAPCGSLRSPRSRHGRQPRSPVSQCRWEHHSGSALPGDAQGPLAQGWACPGRAGAWTAVHGGRIRGSRT